MNLQFAKLHLYLQFSTNPSYCSRYSLANTNSYIICAIVYREFRALETQAPITMADDDDEQTGLHGKCAMIYCEKEQHHDKPKYKQKEFMRLAFFFRYFAIAAFPFHS